MAEKTEKAAKPKAVKAKAEAPLTDDDLLRSVDGVQFCFGFQEGKAVLKALLEAPISVHPGLVDMLKPFLPDMIQISDVDKDGKPELALVMELFSPLAVLFALRKSLKAVSPSAGDKVIDFVFDLTEKFVVPEKVK